MDFYTVVIENDLHYEPVVFNTPTLEDAIRHVFKELVWNYSGKFLLKYRKTVPVGSVSQFNRWLDKIGYRNTDLRWFIRKSSILEPYETDDEDDDEEE